MLASVAAASNACTIEALHTLFNAGASGLSTARASECPEDVLDGVISDGTTACVNKGFTSLSLAVALRSRTDPMPGTNMSGTVREASQLDAESAPAALPMSPAEEKVLRPTVLIKPGGLLGVILAEYRLEKS